MSNKDFLSQFSGENNKPASFNEEQRTPVKKSKKPINPLIIVIPAIIVLTAGVILYFIFIRPNIDVVDFTGQEKEAAVAWIRQQGIDSSGIVFKEVFDFDSAENIIIDQTPISGKVGYSAKMTFTISKGPDPDEKVNVPDFGSMTRSQISEWIKENKLTSTRINATYSDSVETDMFVSADYADCDEITFTRGCSLKISVSKGPRPADEVEMVNFVKKAYEEMEVWAVTKKINLEKVLVYSDTFPEGQVVAQSAKEKEIVKVGDTVTVMVSKGKAVVMEDFVGKSYSIDFTHWKNKNDSVSVLKREMYNSDYTAGDIISQSIKPGLIVTTDLEIVVSKGDPILEKTLSNIDINELRAWKDEVNNNGAADIHVNEYSHVASESVPAGNIVEIYGATKIGANKYRVPVGTTLKVVISKGEEVKMENFVGKSYESDFSPWSAKHKSVSVIKKEQYSSAVPKDAIISQSINPGTIITKDLVIVVSLGEPSLTSLNSMSEDSLKAWMEEANKKGASIEWGAPDYETSDSVDFGNIIKIEGPTKKGDAYYVPVGTTLNPTISKGKYIYLGKTYIINDEPCSWANAKSAGYSEETVRKLGAASGVNFEIRYKYSETVDSNLVINVTLNNETSTIVPDGYVSESDTIIVTICDKHASH